MSNGRCVSGTMAVIVEARKWQEPHQKLGVIKSLLFQS